jgi:type I restriction enzyme, S subunit
MYKSIKVSEFLHRVKDAVELQPDQEYSLVTIKVHHKGVVLRNQTKGKLIGSKMYRISKGQFILSGIDARNGAFGIVPDELDSAIITNDFWCFDIDETKVKRDFFYWLTNTPLFLNACIKSSQGVTQRIRLQRELFFNFEFRFPPLEEQENFLTKIQHADQGLNLLRCELDNQERYISQLKQAILQEAISGQLTAEWRKQNPIQKGDPDTDAAALLSKIKAEKQQLIADGKLKKEKPLPEISPDEIPFSLPDSWLWTNFGNVILDIEAGKSPDSLSHPALLDEWGVIKMSAISWDVFLQNENKQLKPNMQPFKDKEIKKDDFIMTRANTSELVAKSVIVGDVRDKLLLNDKTLRVRFPEFLSKRYFHNFNNGSFARNYYANVAKGSSPSMKNVTRDNIKYLLTPLPPLAEQKAIVEKVDYLMKIIDQLEAQIKHRKQLAEDLMQTVLREAFV